MIVERWRETTLGEIVTLKRGYDLPKRLRRAGTFPVVSSSGVTGTHAEAKVDPPGVVTGRYGTLGAVWYVDEPFWPLNTTLYVKSFKGNHERFIAYLLESLDLGTLVSSAAVPGINRNHLHPLLVRVPNGSLQLSIAAALSAFDELIENNRRRIEIFEEMARLLYREWFVHFRYPGHEDVEIVDSDLGPIPEGWGITTLGDAARWLSGGTPDTREPAYWGGEIPWITSGSLTSFMLDHSDRTLTQLGVDNGSRIVARNTTLFVVRGMSLAKEFRHGVADVPLAFGQDCKALIAKPGIEPLFLALSVSSLADDIQGMVEFAAHGTGKLSTDRIQALTIPHPPEPIQQRFVGSVEPMMELMSNLQGHSRVLRKARNLLLPRLVSGELDVSELDLGLVAV